VSEGGLERRLLPYRLVPSRPYTCRTEAVFERASYHRGTSRPAPAAKLAGDTLRERHSEALAKQDYMAAALTDFQLDLDNGEDERIFLKSKK
jgi:hypothetical protein